MLHKIAAGADTFRASMEGGASSFAGEIGRGAESIDAVVARLGETIAHLGTLVDRVMSFGETSSRIAGQRIVDLQETLAGVDAGFKRVAEASTPFSRSAEQVRAAIDLLRVTESSIQSRLEDFSTAAIAMSSSSQKLVTSVSENVTRLNDGLGSTSDRLAESIAKIATESERAGTTLSETIKATLSEYESRFGAIDGELQRALETLLQAFAKTYEDMRDRVTEVDSQMAESINRLATFNESFKETTEDLAESVEKLSAAVAPGR
jgi:chromosome segregation ATPase